jgi:hypothetical protein
MIRGKIYESHQKERMFEEIPENKGKERKEKKTDMYIIRVMYAR